jgi:hypothetical protein
MNITNNKEGNFLYKYVPYNQYSLQMLINQELWLGPPDMLNDPFEGDFTISNFEDLFSKNAIKIVLNHCIKGISSNDIKLLRFQELQKDRKLFSDYLYEYLNSEIKKGYGATSFSTRCHSMRMWSYYADSHKGFIAVFDRKKLVEEIKYKKDFRLIDIAYNKLPEVELGIDNDKIYIINKQPLMTSKLPVWRPEKEVRLIQSYNFEHQNERRFMYPENSLLGVFFGSRMPVENILTIHRILSHNRSYGKLEFRYAYKNESRTAIILKNLKSIFSIRVHA